MSERERARRERAFSRRILNAADHWAMMALFSKPTGLTHWRLRKAELREKPEFQFNEKPARRVLKIEPAKLLAGSR